MAVVEAVDSVDVLDMMELETAPNVSAPIANLKAILEMYEENGNTIRQEDTMISPFACSVDSLSRSSSVALSTYV
jgi:hypothetical protein